MASTAVQQTAQENIPATTAATTITPTTTPTTQQPQQQAVASTATAPPKESTMGPTSRTDQQRAAQEQKLEMIEAFEALRNGQLPTNDKLCEFLERLLHVSAIENRRQQMSPDGQQLLVDLQDFIRTLQNAIKTKNSDQLFQSLYYHVHQIQPTVNREHFRGIDYTAGTDKETVKSEAQQGANAFMTIGRLVLTNEHFRKQVSELVTIAQEIFGDVAVTVGDTLQTHGQKLSERSQRMGEKAHEIADPEKQRQKADELTERQRQLTQDLEKDDRDNAEILQEKALGQIQSSTEETAATGGTSDLTTSQKLKQELQAQSEMVKGKMKEHWQDQSARAKDYAQDKFPPEKVDDIIRRLKFVLADVQRRADYQKAIDTIIALFQTWSGRLTTVAKETGSKSTEAAAAQRRESNMAQAEQEIKTILEDWAQGKSLDPLVDSVKRVMQDVKDDPDLRQCYDESLEYIRRLLKEPGYVNDEQSTVDGRRLVERGREITQKRYRGHFDSVVNEANAYFAAVEQDPVTKEINMRLNKIHRDLWFDKDGTPAFKPQLLNDMRLTLLPAFLEFVKFLPLPRIEYSDPQFDVVLENIVLSGDTLMPEIFEMEMSNYLRFSPRTNITNANNQTLYIKMGQIQTIINDVVFYYKRKMGFPRMSDRGVASLHIGGKGITVTTKIISDSNDQQHTFRVLQCHCRIDNLRIKIHDSRHDLLYKTVHPLVTTIARRQLAKAVEAKVVEMLQRADGQLTNQLIRMHDESFNKVEQARTEAAAAEASQDSAPAVAGTVPTTTARTSAKQRPGVFATMVAVINNNLKSGALNRRAKQANMQQQQQQEETEKGISSNNEQGSRATDRTSSEATPMTGGTQQQQQQPERPSPAQKVSSGGGSKPLYESEDKGFHTPVGEEPGVEIRDTGRNAGTAVP